MAWTIYCHTHTDTGRRYVGLTSRTWQRRWAQHLVQSRSTKGGRWHFPNAIRLHGKDAFDHHVLEVCETLETANAAEERWIEEYDTRNPEKGFNLRKGGSHTPHLVDANYWDRPGFRERMSAILREAASKPESRRKRSESSKKLWGSPGFKTKMSLISKEVHSRPDVIEKSKRSQLGKHHSPASKAKMSLARRGVPVGLDARKKISSSMKKVMEDPSKRMMISSGLRGKLRTESEKRQLSEHYRSLRERRQKSFLGMECRIHGHVAPKRCYVKNTASRRRVERKECLRDKAAVRRTA